MFKINKKTNKITITKGDNASIIVQLQDIEGNERKIFKDDVITFTVRKRITGEVVISKNAVDGVITLIPDDTNFLAIGQYRYDIQLTTFGGNIYTVIPDAIFEIGGEITR